MLVLKYTDAALQIFFQVQKNLDKEHGLTSEGPMCSLE